jgi:3-phenylpropionate/trans-cinnamate dioxygenase ferredoxin subunit
MPKHIIGTVNEIPPGERKIVDVNGRSIGVYNVAGEFFAIRNRCPHKGGPLCEGRTAGFMKCDRPGAPYEYLRKGEIVRCPWHGWEYDLKSGQSWVDPASVRVRSYDVGIESTEPADIEIDPDTGYAKGPFLAETYPVSIDKLNVVLDLP